MNIKKQICTVEQAKALWDLGVRPKSLPVFAFAKIMISDDWNHIRIAFTKNVYYHPNEPDLVWRYLPAYTVAELKAMDPPYSHDSYRTSGSRIEEVSFMAMRLIDRLQKSMVMPETVVRRLYFWEQEDSPSQDVTTMIDLPIDPDFFTTTPD